MVRVTDTNNETGCCCKRIVLVMSNVVIIRITLIIIVIVLLPHQAVDVTCVLPLTTVTLSPSSNLSLSSASLNASSIALLFIG